MASTPAADLTRVSAHIAGAEPPPGAPHETSQPLSRDAGRIAVATNPRTGESYAREDWHTMSPAERARHNERQLEPLKATGPTTGGIAEAVDAVAEGKLDPFYQNLAQRRGVKAMTDLVTHVETQQPPARAGRITRAVRLAATPAAPVIPAIETPREETPISAAPPARVSRRPAVPVGDPPAVAGDAAEQAAPVEAFESVAPQAAPVQYIGDTNTPAAPAPPTDLTIYPAGSDTEDPSRGQPRMVQRPGKEITGGFADQAALQYFALDGHELGILVKDMLTSVSDRITNDLRFNEAITYPRVGVRVWVEVSGFADDQSFTVDKVMPDALQAAGHGDPAIKATALEIAREVADEVVFVIVAEKREADANGDPLDPPDKIRQELGLARPRKQMIRGPGNSTQMVDVVR